MWIEASASCPSRSEAFPKSNGQRLFCASDMLAIPAMRAVVENQGRIPEDIAIVGMDNIDVAQYTTPR